MTTVDPDTLAVDPEVLRDIARRFGGRLALNAEVVRGGRLAVGDRVQRKFSTSINSSTAESMRVK